jgi:hypothetical protein
VKVAGLLEPGALVEIEGVAMLPDNARASTAGVEVEERK